VTAKFFTEIKMSTPLARAQAKIEEIERELRKCPDFQLYLIANDPHDRLRMERVLLAIPNFELWFTLKNSIVAAATAVAGAVD
jgi:hypothetical protein